jgi:hypothetical protein
MQLVFAGLEMGSIVRDIGGSGDETLQPFLITLVTGSIVSAWANDGVGFCVGALTCVTFYVMDRMAKRKK